MKNMKIYTAESNCVGLNNVANLCLSHQNDVTKRNKTKYDKNCKFDLKFKNKGNA